MKIATWGALLLLLAGASPARSQPSGAWGPTEKNQALKHKKPAKESHYQRWRKHISQWGTDSAFNHSLSLAGRLNTHGWSAGLVYTHRLEGAQKALWQLHFSETRHIKEASQQLRPQAGQPNAPIAPAFVFGKTHRAYFLNLSYGREQALLPALVDGHLSLSFRYSIGPSLALLKPYYLKILHTVYVPEEKTWVEEEKYGDDNADLFLQVGRIAGSAPWSKGLGELRYIPGLFAELAFTLESGRPQAFAQTLTLGGQCAYYARPIDIMAKQPAYPYQACFFIGIALGKRWK